MVQPIPPHRLLVAREAAILVAKAEAQMWPARLAVSPRVAAVVVA